METTYDPADIKDTIIELIDSDEIDKAYALINENLPEVFCEELLQSYNADGVQKPAIHYFLKLLQALPKILCY